ncbi:MAG: hypothetical protein AAB799_01630, partial [Patescibacteria group bacterium]
MYNTYLRCFLKRGHMLIMRLFLSFIVFCLVLGLNMTPAYGQISVRIDTHTGEFVVQTVIKRTVENDALKKENLTYKRIYTVDNLDDNEQITSREKEEIVSVERGGKERLIQKNGKPVNRGRTSSPRFDLIKVLEAMVKLDSFNVVSIEMMGERPHYVVSFEPKPHQKTDGNVEEVIVRSRGIMYVDIEKFYVRKISAWMPRSYSRVWGIFSLTRANID